MFLDVFRHVSFNVSLYLSVSFCILFLFVQLQSCYAMETYSPTRVVSLLSFFLSFFRFHPVSGYLEISKSLLQKACCSGHTASRGDSLLSC